MPYWKSKKLFLNSGEALNRYLSLNESFTAYHETVLASDKALYFPKLFCVVPFDQIQSIKLSKQLWEQDVYFNLINGQKFYIVSKQYDNILKAINEHQ